MDVYSEPLFEVDVLDDPLEQFSAWFDRSQAVVRIPEAACLATVGSDGRPSARMVLCHRVDSRGFVFYTNYESRKGGELAQHGAVALVFYWDPLGRQVRVEGMAERLSEKESDSYFATRPRGSQIGAHASAQSVPIADRETLEERVGRIAASFEGHDVPRPAWWGGFLVSPDLIEFWQNREDRLHDRIRFRRVDRTWQRDRLQP